MGVLDLFKRSKSAGLRGAAGGSGDDELFDDEFQRKLDYLAMVSRRVFSGAMRAERRTKKTGSGVEFADHRDYVPGDDFRYLDWSVYQRFDRLLIRLIPRPEYSPKHGEQLIRDLKARVGEDMRIDIEFVKEMPRTARGKFKWVISEIDTGL